MKMGEVVIYVDDEFVSGVCRICHEEEEFESLETPCACSGTVKFAHRDCIQRWCNEKGNTTCEICLQKFEPGYSVPPRKKVHLVDNTAVTIRRSLEVLRRSEAELESRRTRIVVMESESENSEYSECSQAADRSAFYCRTMALILTIILLVRHLVGVLDGAAKHYPFSLPTLLLLKASGIVVPMYIIIVMISRIQNVIRRQYLDSEDMLSNSDEDN